MLHTLSIRDFVIVDVLDLEFSTGFSVFTGQTGAGKSILIDALALLLGGRSDASVVRDGATKADIWAEFLINPLILDWLTTYELHNDEAYVLVRRVIDNTGRTKAFINGISATATQLRELGELLVDIHGQHAHQSLLKISAQRVLLDTWAGLSDQVAILADIYKEWKNVVKQCDIALQQKEQLNTQRDQLTWQLAELEKVTPKAGEWEEINKEHSRLSNAAQLIQTVQEVQLGLSDTDDCVLSQVFTIKQKISKLLEFDDSLTSVHTLLDSAHISLQEAALDVNHYLGKIELDQERLVELDTRLTTLFSAARTFRVTPEELPRLYSDVTEQLNQLAVATDIEALHLRAEQLSKDYAQAAKKLSQTRAKKAQALSKAVTDAMQELSMVGGCFEIALTPCEPTSYGIDQIEFLVAGHQGVIARPLAKVASGGELARIALAISVITSTATATPTLIFDEVDSGIGGAVAQVVGRLLKQLGQHRQVLCVTHLPQVASLADTHFEVSKIEANTKVVSRVTVLEHDTRVEEIARMLGGVEITATTRQHARELLT